MQRTLSPEDFRQVVGGEHVREAVPDDAVDGVVPSIVVEPGSVEEVSEVLKLASGAGLKVAPRGSGTKMELGNPPAGLDVILSTRRLNRIIEHAAGDLVAGVQAGVRLEDLQEELSGANQMLALDPPEAEGTVGGIVAADASGPRRLRYGTARDLLIGITVVLADGTVARAGGKVVKNVAGYDLSKLFTRSLGTLGVIVETIWRLHPVPFASGTVAAELEDAASAGAAVQSILHSSLVPGALELRWRGGRGRLAVLIEGVKPGVEAQSRAARELLGEHGEARILDESEEDELWSELLPMPWESGGIGLKIAGVPAGLPDVLESVERITGRYGFEPEISGHAGTGVTFVGLSGGDEDSRAAAIGELRRGVEERGGSLVLVQAPAELKRRVEVWGSTGDALQLMRRVKERFDPGYILNPGRFVGGI
ncbi:FAD-binding oxidoreductase [Rubrobacter taiwanensis]|uniref:FAD-binding oxidoreductase n=1 Tax=Rubrobacter taiwanensis TaxID=185139 RepID=UPI001A9F96C3|nr:FAD-binding oxidoreductase [Rubrobacter taiwanensis]